MDLTRIFQVFIAHGFMFSIYWILAFFLLKTRRSRIKTIFACFYFFTGLGYLINMIFFFIFIEEIVLILWYIAAYCVLGSPIYLMIFSLTYWKGENIITPKKQYFLVILFYIVFSFSLLIPNGITINESTDWRPVWSLLLTLYYFFIVLIFIAVPSWYFIYRKIVSIDPIEKNIKKGWIVFLLGNMFYGVSGLALLLIRFFFSETILVYVSVLGILFSAVGAFLMYYGLRHEFKIEF